MTDLRAQVEAAIDAYCWSEFAGSGEVMTIVMRDDAIDAAMAVFNERLDYMANNTRGRCRWCNVITSEALAYLRGPRMHRMTCRFYVGPVEHRLVRMVPVLIGWRNDCSCGGSWRDEEGGCPNAAESWRGPLPEPTDPSATPDVRTTSSTEGIQ